MFAFRMLAVPPPVGIRFCVAIHVFQITPHASAIFNRVASICLNHVRAARTYNSDAHSNAPKSIMCGRVYRLRIRAACRLSSPPYRLSTFTAPDNLPKDNDKEAFCL